MRRLIEPILSATLALACAAVMAEGRPSGAPTVAEHQHNQPEPASTVASPGKGPGREWSKYPLLTPLMGGERGTAKLAVKNLQPVELEVFAAEGASERLRRQVPVDPEGTAIEAVSPKIGNYHWVSAREAAEGKVTVASTVYAFGNPGAAPTKLLLAQKSELEIIPQPLPREHGAWRESEEWQFLLRFNGQPLAKKAVRMETEFGSRIVFTSDEHGVVTVLFPRDFKPLEKKSEPGSHSHGPRRAKFVLAAEHDADGTHYLTAFNYTYSAAAARDRNLLAGVGFGVFGMLLATPLLRRRKNNNENPSR